MTEEVGLSRQARTLIRLADLGAGALADLAPGGSLSYEALKELAQHAWQHRHERASERLRAFHLHLISPTNDEERRKLLEQDFDLEDYYVVLESVLADEEHDKVPFYAKLMRSLILEDFDGRTRSHLIRSFRGLAVADLDLFGKIAEATLSEARMPDVQAPEQLVQRLIPERDALAQASVQNLIAWGYLKYGDRSGIPWPTRLSDLLAKVASFAKPRR